MQNFRLKSDKERAKAVKQTFKHLKISRYTRDGEIKQKILAFVRQNAVDYSRFGLPDNLLADAEFLTLLFKADGEATVYFAPNSRDKGLLENHNFMLEYIKRKGEMPQNLIMSFAKLIAFYKTDMPNDDAGVMEFMKKSDIKTILANKALWDEDLSFLADEVAKYL